VIKGLKMIYSYDLSNFTAVLSYKRLLVSDQNYFS